MGGGGKVRNGKELRRELGWVGLIGWGGKLVEGEVDAG